MISTSLPIKFSDVCLEIYGSSNTAGKSQNQAFIDATGTFNSTYVGSKDRLSNFRGYSHALILTPFYMSPSPSTNCGNTSWILRYHDGTDPIPYINDAIYMTSTGTLYTQGGGQNFMFKDNGSGLWKGYGIVANSGYVVTFNIC